MNSQNYRTSEVRDLDRLPCFRVNVLCTFEVGCLYGNGVCENGMSDNVEVEFAMAGLSRFAKMLSGRSGKPGTRTL